MSTNNDIKRNITESLSREFPKCPVIVQESPEDSKALWVQVFCVPVAQEENVEASIFLLQDTLAPEGEFMLLPMVKDLEITRQYYPEHLPKEPVAAQVVTLVDLFSKLGKLQRWSSVSAPDYASRECYAVSRQIPILAAVSRADEMLQPATQRESTVPAKGNYAFAA